MAVVTDTRQTGLIARVIDSNLNSWEDFASLDINIPVVYQPVDSSAGEWDQAHWSYRGQASICALEDGRFVRVRIGDWTNTSSRVVQRQIIDSPQDPSDWTLWTTLYSGSHYAIAVEADPDATAGYRVYSAKSDGLYMDNVKILDLTNIVHIKTVTSKRNMLLLKTVEQDPDANKAERWWYVTNTLAASPQATEDDASFRWYHQDMAVVQGSPSWYYRFRAWPMNASARHQYASDTLTCDVAQEELSAAGIWTDRWHDPRALKGPSGQSGFKRIDNMHVSIIVDSQFTNGAYYLFYTEQHMDAYGNTLSNLKSPVFWSRSIGYPYYLSEATPTGFSVWGLAGVVDDTNYVYIAGNGRVLRRPLQPSEIDISDYVIEGSYELPRDNGEGKGSLLCANPHNELGVLLGMSSSSDTLPLTERRVDLGVGVKRGGGSYSFKKDTNWWLTNIGEVEEGGKQRLLLELGDFWHRMANPFRDVWNIPGRFEWHDWQPGAANNLQYWHNDTDEWHAYTPTLAPGVDADSYPRLRVEASGDGPLGGSITLLTATGVIENGYIEANFWEPSGSGIVFRYVDVSNFYYVDVVPDLDEPGSYLLTLHRVKGGVDSFVGLPVTVSDTPDNWMSVDFRWGTVVVTFANDNTITWDSGSGLGTPEVWAGSVGLFAPTKTEVSNVYFHEWNSPTTTRELVKMLLAYVDEHDVAFEGGVETLDADIISTTWGPQFVPTPEEAMRQLLGTSKLNIAWLPD